MKNVKPVETKGLNIILHSPKSFHRRQFLATSSILIASEFNEISNHMAFRVKGEKEDST